MLKTLHSAQQQIFLRLLKTLREDSGTTQRELAKSIGVDQTYVSKCEQGIRRLDVIELRRWVAGLGVPFDAFTAAVDEALDALESQQASSGRRAGLR
jgi:transcriptional regulator with XRE-family HTH domain